MDPSFLLEHLERLSNTLRHIDWVQFTGNHKTALLGTAGGACGLLTAAHLLRRGAERTPVALPAPIMPLHPPSDDRAWQWWENWMLSVRTCTDYTAGIDGQPHLVSQHLFLGSASAKNIIWRQRATPTDYSGTGGIRRWAHQKYRDWEDEGPYPLYVHQDILKEHTYIVGPTGTGKTSFAIMPMLIQLIHGHRLPNGPRSPLLPIIIIDLKGDNALFHTVREEVQKEGLQQFKFFNLERGSKKNPANSPATYRFNPFRGFNPDLRTFPQLCQMILDALALNHGRGYGRSYYTERSRSTLMKALEKEPQPMSLPELKEALEQVLKNEKDRQARTDAFELLSVIESLTEYDQLITSPKDELENPESIIFMPDVLTKRQVVYFWLPAALESISAGEVAKLVLFNLRAAAQDHKRLYPHDPLRTVLVIDELQRVAGENLAGILQDARSFGIGAILANQSLYDLKSPTGFDLAQGVLTNTRLKLFFTSPNNREYYAFVARGEGLTRARPYPQQNHPWLKELPLEHFAYTVHSAWPIPRDLYCERDSTPLPGWSAVPGGNWRLHIHVPSEAPTGHTPHKPKRPPALAQPPRDEQLSFIHEAIRTESHAATKVGRSRKAIPLEQMAQTIKHIANEG